MKVFEVVIGLVMSILVVVMTALSTWLFKIDDRQFRFQADMVTRQELRQELRSVESNLDRRLTNIEEALNLLVERDRENLIRERNGQ